MSNLASALSESSWDVHVLSPHPRQVTEVDGKDSISHHFLSFKNPDSVIKRILGTFRGYREARRRVRDIDPDIILDDISHFPYFPLYYPRLNVGSTHAVFLHTSYLSNTEKTQGPVYGKVLEGIERSIPYLRDPYVICAGDSTAENIQQHTGHKKTTVLNPCIDTGGLEFDYNPESNVFTYLGRFSNRKNIDCLLDAWTEIEANYPNYELKLAGDGPTREDMELMSRNLGHQNVDFLGFVDEETKAELLTESLCFIHPSRLEGYSTTGLEALASGCVVVGADVPGVRDYISHEKNGFLFTDDSPSDLSRKMEHVIENRPVLSEVVDNGRKTAQDHEYQSFRNRADDVFKSLI